MGLPVSFADELEELHTWLLAREETFGCKNVIPFGARAAQAVQIKAVITALPLLSLPNHTEITSTSGLSNSLYPCLVTMKAILNKSILPS